MSTYRALYDIVCGLFIIAGTYILSQQVFEQIFKEWINFRFRDLPLSWKLVLLLFCEKRKFDNKELWQSEGAPLPENITVHQKIKFIMPFIGFVLICIGTIAQVYDKKIDWDKLGFNLHRELKSTTNKSEAEIHEAMGYTLLKTDNQWERAEVYFKKAVELNPKLYLSWYNLGLIYIDTDEGNNYFKKAMEANPNYPPPYYWLGYTYCRNRKDKEAVPLFKKYLEVAKNNSNESIRVAFVQKVLKELISGKEDASVKTIRKPFRRE